MFYFHGKALTENAELRPAPGTRQAHTPRDAPCTRAPRNGGCDARKRAEKETDSVFTSETEKLTTGGRQSGPKTAIKRHTRTALRRKITETRQMSETDSPRDTSREQGTRWDPGGRGAAAGLRCAFREQQCEESEGRTEDAREA